MTSGFDKVEDNLEAYAEPLRFFDEMRVSDGKVRAAYARFSEWLASIPNRPIDRCCRWMETNSHGTGWYIFTPPQPELTADQVGDFCTAVLILHNRKDQHLGKAS